MNKKIAMSALSIVASLALIGGATFAYFTSTASSTGNTFTSGTMNLTVGDDNDPLTSGLNSVTASIHSPTDWAPGQEFQSFSCFKNSGSVGIEEIILAMNTANPNLAFENAIIAKKVELGKVPASECNSLGGDTTLTDFTSFFVQRFDSADTVGTNDNTVRLGGLLADVDGTDHVEDDLLNGGSPADLQPGEVVKFRVTWLFDPLATNASQGQSLNFNINYTAYQNEVAE